MLEIDLYDVIGIIGAICLLFSYMLFQSDNISIFKFSYLNIIGSSFIIINLCFKWNISSFLIEFGWLIISIYGVIKHFKTRKEKCL